MPTYVYEATKEGAGCESCNARFEIVQRMSDDPLSLCPLCGASVRRVIQAANINTSIIGGKISDSKLKSAGFTKLVKGSDGKYKKAFGNDPAAGALPSL